MPSRKEQETSRIMRSTSPLLRPPSHACTNACMSPMHYLCRVDVRTITPAVRRTNASCLVGALPSTSSRSSNHNSALVLILDQ